MKIDPEDPRMIVSDSGYTKVWVLKNGQVQGGQIDIAEGCLSEEDRALWFFATGKHRDQ